jgi:hypothetical protein
VGVSRFHQHRPSFPRGAVRSGGRIPNSQGPGLHHCYTTWYWPRALAKRDRQRLGRYLRPCYCRFYNSFSSLAHDIVQGLRDNHGDTRGANFSTDAPGWATSQASNGATRSHEERERERERERDRCTTGRVARKWVTGTLTESVSSGEGEMD